MIPPTLFFLKIATALWGGSFIVPFLSLLKLILYLKMWFIFENVPCALAKNVSSTLVGAV